MLQLTLSAHPRSAAEARRFAADVLREWDEEPLADAVVLLVSELVTNAVLHAGSPVQVSLWRHGDRVHVGVADESPVMPAAADYGDDAMTGRGLELVEMMAEAWGVDRRDPAGKVVWFELPSSRPHATPAGADPPASVTAAGPGEGERDVVTVRLLGVPVRLFPAMRQHTDALLREYALMGLAGSEAGPPHLDVDLNPITDQLAAAVAAGHPTMELVLRAPRTARPSIARVRDALEHADALAANGLLLNPPPLPEVRACRDWFLDQLLVQLDGADPAPWVVSTTFEDDVPSATIDFSAVLDLVNDAVVIATDENRIAYANAATEAVLGWAPEDLVGRRLTTIIPQRLHEAHVSGFTRYLVTREARLLGQPVRVPARRRDGSEIDIELRLHALRTPGERQMFMGTLHPSPDAVAVPVKPAATYLQELLEAVAAAATPDGDVREPLLAAIGTQLRWEFLAWWSGAPDGGHLECGAVWESTPGRYRQFRTATTARRFRRGEGLPGRVWSSGQPEWIPDVVADANFPRVALAVQHDLRAACAFPVTVDDTAVGVVEMYGAAVTPPDRELITALRTLGRVLGMAVRQTPAG